MSRLKINPPVIARNPVSEYGVNSVTKQSHAWNRLPRLRLAMTQQGFLKLTKRSLASLLIILTVFIGTGFIYLFGPFAKRTEAVWFDDNWGYRKAITVTVTTNSSDISNLETLLTVDTTGITAKLQSACQDLRFTNTNGKLLPYYIDSCSNNSATNKIWVMADLVPKNTTTYTVYMYYGNPGAVAGSNSSKFDNVVGLKGYWTLNDGSGTTATDTSVTTLSGTLTNNSGSNPTWNTSTGKYSNDVTFTAANASFIKMANNASINNLTVTTTELWVKTSGTSMILFSTWDGGNGFQVHITGGGNAALWSNTGGTLDSGVAVNDNSFHHIATVWDGTTGYIYVDGVFKTSAARTIAASTKDSQIGTQCSGSSSSICSAYFTGDIDDVKVYNTARTASQITADYTNTSCGGQTCTIATTAVGTITPSTSFATEEKAPSPVAYWKFDDGTGTNANDSTSNNLDGTLGGSVPPAWKTEDQCIFGKCLYFDGSAQANNGKVTVSESASTPTNITGDLTISTWIKPTANFFDNPGYFIRNGQGSDEVFAVDYDYTNKRVDFNWYDGTFKQVNGATNGVPLNQWSYIQITRSGTTLNIYVNGKLNTTGTVTTPTPQASSLSIGQTNNDAVAQDYTGFIDELKIYNYARSAAQIQADFNARSNNEGASVILGSSNNQPAALSNGLVGYWKMDESSWTVDCSTTSVTDSSGNANNGKSCPTTTGPAGGAAGKFGNAGSFDGINDYVDIPTATSLNNTTFTVGFWAKWGSNAGEQVLATKGGVVDHANWHLVKRVGGSFKATIYGGDDVIFNSPTDGTWYQYVAIYNTSGSNTTITTYVNGAQQNSATQTALTTPSGSSLFIGAFQQSSIDYATVTVDDFRVYNRALSSAEVSQLYNFAPGPVGYWKMEEKSGTSANDSSGNGQTGTINGNPTWVSSKSTGSALNFDGTGDYISYTLPSTSPLKISGALTLGFWMNTTTGTSDAGLVGTGINTGYQCTHHNGGTVYCYISGGGNNVTASVGTGVWKYISFTWDGTTGTNGMKIYVDGVLTNQATSSVATASGWTTLQIGNASTAYNGKLDDVKIYNYARTQGQVIEDMNAGHPAPGSPVGTPLGYWKFDEGYSTIANNSGSQGQSLQGTLTSMASPATSTSGWTQAGKFGKALLFDGTDDYLSIGSNSGLDGNDGITFSFWAKPTSCTNQSLPTIYNRSAQSGTTGFHWMYFNGNCGVNYQYADGAAPQPVTATSALTAGSWNHVVIIHDRIAKSIKGYVNGVLTNTNTYSGTALAVTSGTAFIGVYQGNTGAATYDYQGVIDEFKIYGQALTADQVKLDMNRGASQVLGAASNNSSYQVQAANQEYCVPGDATSCVAPVGRWDFEEGTSTAVNDTSGNANTGTWNGTGSHWKSGKVGKGGNFNGSDDYVNVADAASLRLTSVGTLEAWIKPTSIPSSAGTWAAVANKGNWGNGINNYSIYYQGSDTSLKFEVRGPSAAAMVSIANSNAPINTWSHLVMTWDGTTVTAYVNGIQKGTASQTQNITDLNTGFFIGSPQGTVSSLFTGAIDNVRVFNYARSAAQVAWDYNKGGPVGWWKMDECQGTVANDSSGNSNTGTITIGGTGTQTSAGTCSTASTAWGNGVTGKRNYSLAFDGTDDYATVTRTAALEPTNPTISCWVKFGAFSANHQLCVTKQSTAGGSNSYALGILGTTNKPVFVVGTAAGSESNVQGSALSTGTWYHLTGTYDGTNMTLYVNGSSVATSAPAITIGYSASYNIGIGAEQSANVWYVNGQIDDTRIYNYALTPLQIKTLYNGGAVGFQPTTGAP